MDRDQIYPGQLRVPVGNADYLDLVIAIDPEGIPDRRVLLLSMQRGRGGGVLTLDRLFVGNALLITRPAPGGR